MAPNADELFADADGAFVGTLVELPNTEGIENSLESVPYVFEVVSGHKGDITEPMTVWSAASGASCGLELAEGSSASLFVQKVGDRWEGALCQTMGPEALAEFPEVTVGDAPEPNPLDDPSSNVARWVLGGLAVGAVGALAITRLRRNDASTMPES